MYVAAIFIFADYFTHNKSVSQIENMLAVVTSVAKPVFVYTGDLANLNKEVRS